MKNRKAIEQLTTKVIVTRKWQAACLEQRERYEADPVEYARRYGNDINWVVWADLVETIGMADEARLATMLGCPEDEPFEPFIDAYLKRQEE